jgi:GntR family transcriptional repressor for pyruvate dehydrogenase complex
MEQDEAVRADARRRPVRGHSGRTVNRTGVADQIIAELRQKILGGSLLSGAQLPTERELAEEYGVSGATVREAVRALAAMGFVDVRHGSGSYVTARPDTFAAASIASIVQLENVGAFDVIKVLGLLIGYAAELAAEKASAARIASVRKAAERLASVSAVQQTLADLKAFHRELVKSSQNKLLEALCNYLVDVQAEIGLALAGNSLRSWKQLVGSLQPDRMAIVEALEERNSAKALAVTRAFHEHTLALIGSSPRAKKLRSSDPELAGLITSLMASSAVLGGREG